MLEPLKTVDKCDILHSKFELLLKKYQADDEQKFEILESFFKVFKNETNLGVLTTLLIICKAFKYHPSLHAIGSELNERCKILRNERY